MGRGDNDYLLRSERTKKGYVKHYILVDGKEILVYTYRGPNKELKMGIGYNGIKESLRELMEKNELSLRYSSENKTSLWQIKNMRPTSKSEQII